MNEEDTGHIPSMLLCNSSGLFGVHKIGEVKEFVIDFLKYLRKNLMQDNQQFTIPAGVQQFNLFSIKQFEVCRLQINQQDDGWSCGFHSLLAQQNFSKVLLEE